MSKVLEVKNLHFSYGEIQALRGINLEVHEDEIVTIIGSNGAGKTTTLQAISGLISGITEGEIHFFGEDITSTKPHDIADKGLSHCLEGRHIFGNLTVMENLKMGAYLRKDSQGIQDDLNFVLELFPRLGERENQDGRTLSGGEQQMLAVGRAIMQHPKLIMLDEPSLGLAPLIIRDIFRTIQRIKERGIPVLLVEQNSNAALKIADRGYVLQNGEMILEDTAANLSNNPLVKASYLGL